MQSILDIKNLKISFDTIYGTKVNAINGIDLKMFPRETLAIVGESGSGKTQLVLAIMRLLASNANISGEIIYNNKNLVALSDADINQIRGNDISMIFQDPMTSLNPYLKISIQMSEILIEKKGVPPKEALEQSINMLNLLSIPEASKRIHQYPHQFSGGMRQRIMIAMALLSNPKILIADEPTTALDVTIQAQILDILEKIKTNMGVSIIFITHDLSVVSDIADKIAVFYGGKVVEYGSRDDIFNNPMHPYTKALLKSMPSVNSNRGDRLFSIDGYPSVTYEEPKLCVFKDRCNSLIDLCKIQMPVDKFRDKEHCYKCLLDVDMLKG